MCVCIIKVWHHFLELQPVQEDGYVTFKRRVVEHMLLQGLQATALAIFTFQVIVLFYEYFTNIAAKLFLVPTVFSARQHAERAICYRPSVRPSVCLSVRPSHGWIS